MAESKTEQKTQNSQDSKNLKLLKKGKQFEKMKSFIRPFDLILFKGSEIISDTIRFLEKTRLGKGAGEFSHVGMIVTSEILDHPKIKDNRLYIWESTMSGDLGEKVKNVENRSFLGSQLRDFEDVMEKYDASKSTAIAWAKLTQNPCDNKSVDELKELKVKFNAIFRKYNGRPYDANIFSLMGALFPCLRQIRDCTEWKFINSDWLFCSELCFHAYQDVGLYDVKFDARDVVPVDFIGFDEDGIPNLFEKHVYITAYGEDSEDSTPPTTDTSEGI